MTAWRFAHAAMAEVNPSGPWATQKGVRQGFEVAATFGMDSA